MPNTPAAAMDALSTPIYLGRQPILDRARQLVGFELLFRDGPLNVARIQDQCRATATVVIHAFSELGLSAALGNLDAYLNVDADFLFEESIQLLPPAQIVLEVLETVSVTPAIVERCRELRAQGFRIALDDVVERNDARAPLFEHTDIFKIDVLATPDAALAPLTAALRRPRAALLAEKIDRPEQFERCLELGFDLFQGYHFARPSVLTGRKLDNSKLVLLKLMSQVLEDAETPQLEASFKQAPGLTINLLRLVNSVAGGLPVRISSLRHAITVLGRRQLQRWLQLLLYTDPAAPDRLTSPLLQLAATRGRLMEVLASLVNPRDGSFSDHAFVCGVMSLTPALLEQPLAQILAQVSLAAPISEALLNRRGRLGQLLDVVETMESENLSALSDKLLELPMLRPEILSSALAEALRWANLISAENADD